MSDPRTLVKNRQYIDLPGESPKGKMWPSMNNIIQLRQHRDVVFDIRLGNGATYTVVADKGRVYDPKRGLNVTRTMFNDGEPCHLWVGRFFEGNLILKQGDKEISRYPISQMDCTQGCRNTDPTAKPSPVLVILHDDKAFAQQLLEMERTVAASMTPASPVLTNALERGRANGGLQGAPFGSSTASAVASARLDMATQVAARNPSEMADAGAGDALQMLHVFGGVQIAGPAVPEAVARWVASGRKSLKLDPKDIVTRNWILGQMAGVGGYFRDALGGNEAWLRQFWNRAFIMERSSSGKFVVMFSTSVNERRNLGYLLGAYHTVSHDSRVMTVAGGAGSLSASGKAAWTAANSSIRGGAGMAVAFTVMVDCISWWDDYNYGRKDFKDLAVAVGIDLAKAGIVAAATSASVALVATIAAAAFGFSAPVLTIVIGAVIAMVAIGYGVDLAFQALDVNGWLTRHVRESGKLLESKLPKNYADIYTKSLWRITEEGVEF